MITKCGNVWVRIVKWDMLPHLFTHKPTGLDDLSSYNRISWEDYRNYIIGRK